MTQSKSSRPKKRSADSVTGRTPWRPAQLIPTTRVSAIILNCDKEILLVQHKKGNRSYLALPGGRLKYAETFEECALREVREETGLDIEIAQFVFLSQAIAPDRSRHILNICLTAKITGGLMKLGDDPVLQGVDFFPISTLSESAIYPPVGEQILQGVAGGFGMGLEYLGNRWF